MENMTLPPDDMEKNYKLHDDEKLKNSLEEKHIDQKQNHLIATIIGAASDKDIIALRRILLPLHPADLASILRKVSTETTRKIITLIGEELDPEVFAELDEDTKELFLDILPTKSVARALEDLDTDDAVAFFEELDEEDRAEVLAEASEELRTNIETSLAFEEETAGRLMQREFVAAPEFWDTGRTIDYMRSVGEDLPDLFFEVYVVDPSFKPIGAIAVSKLMRASRKVLLKDLMDNLHVIIRPETDQEDVAIAFQKYHLISAPVVDDAGRLNGMITVDDIVNVVSEESQEDLLALAGVSESTGSNILTNSISSRLPWLLLNLFTALIASFFIDKFSAVIEQIVALAVLMPIVASLGGNAGTQALAVTVRAIAAREVDSKHTLRNIFFEMLTGLINGTAIGVILAIIAGVWFHNPKISLTIGLAVLLNNIAAGFAGIFVPLTLRRLGYDPAVSSGVLVTFVTDMVGFVAFLGLATVIVV